jgi:hypothetical protein
MPQILVVHVRKSQFDVYIGRAFLEYPASKWGNPFPLRNDTPQERYKIVEQYKEYIRSKPELWNALPELEGKVMGCWCRPKYPCHGDALLELIEEYKDAVLRQSQVQE